RTGGCRRASGDATAGSAPARPVAAGVRLHSGARDAAAAEWSTLPDRRSVEPAGQYDPAPAPALARRAAAGGAGARRAGLPAGDDARSRLRRRPALPLAAARPTLGPGALASRVERRGAESL